MSERPTCGEPIASTDVKCDLPAEHSGWHKSGRYLSWPGPEEAMLAESEALHAAGRAIEEHCWAMARALKDDPRLNSGRYGPFTCIFRNDGSFSKAEFPNPNP